MIDIYNVTVKLKTGNSWVVIENIEVTVNIRYDDYYNNSASDDMDVVHVKIPSWASTWKKLVSEYLTRNPEKVTQKIVEITI